MRSRKSRFLSVITLVAVLGISCGVMALTIVLSVTGGFQEAFRDRILGLHPHLLVWPRDERFDDYRNTIERLKSDPRVIGATPATYDEVMMAHGDRRAGAVVKGVDPATVADVLDLPTLMIEGTMDALGEEPSVVREGNEVRIGGLVQETAWTAVLWGDGQVMLHLEQPGAPLPEEAEVVVVNAAPKLGAIDVALSESKVARVSALAPGRISRPMVVPAGDVALRVGDQPLFAGDVTLESARSYLLLVRPDGSGELLPMDRERPPVGEARLRLVDARTTTDQPITVRSGPETIPPGESRAVPGHPPAIVLGDALAERLEAGVGDMVTLASPFKSFLGDRGLTPTGMEPTSGRFRVSGIFRSGYYDYDKRFAVVAFGAATRFLNTGDRAKWLEVRIDDIFRIEERKRVVQDLLQPYSMASFVEDVRRANQRVQAVLNGDVSQFEVEDAKSPLGLLRNSAQVLGLMRSSMPHTFSRRSSYAVITWHEVNEPLFQALKLQKLVLSIFFLIIIVVAAFNVVGTQIMMVQQKTREIAILKALGSSNWMVRKVFLIQGLIVAALGTSTGLVAGLGVCFLLDLVGYPLEPEVYLISELPVTIDMVEIGAVVVAALILTFLATLYSASRAGRLMPAEGIRYIE